ncbi:TetR/AcrR family transcriptional regulator [Priestia megaterium]|nr:TetR/AcrR family transcriptional regulator [Priestia megaterium]
MPSKHQDIFSASLLLFAEKGFDATTIPMIAKTANVGAGTIYRYFKSKDDLVNELFQRYVSEFLTCIQNGFSNQTTGFRERFHYIFNGMVKFRKNHPHALSFIKKHSQGDFLTAESRNRYKRLLDVISVFLEEGKAEHMIRPLNKEVLIAILIGGFMEVCELIENQQVEETETLLLGVEESLWSALSM